MTGEIEKLVDRLHERPAEFEEGLRNLLRRDLGAFRNSALAIARANATSPRHARLIQFLSQVHLLAQAAADPAESSVESAVTLARAAAAAGAPVDQDLAALLKASLKMTREARSTARLLQLLEILYALDRGNLALPHQTELSAHPDPRVRSRAALLIVRATRNAGWVASRLLKDEPRVQAEAVEAMWGIEDDDCRGVLKLAAGSPHSRVAAAALVGMHLLGDAGAAAALLKMGAQDAAASRVDAVWAMGQTEDARFLPFLTARFATADAGLRPAVLRSLTRIRRRVRAWSESGEMAVSVCGAADLGDGSRKLELALSSNVAEDITCLNASHFAVFERGSLITEYSFASQPNAPLLAVAFEMPRIVSPADPYAECLDNALISCLQLKRKCDFWCIDRYSLDSGNRQQVDEIASICVPLPSDPALAPHFKKHHGFAMDADVIRKVIPGAVHRERAARDVLTGIRRLFESTYRIGGNRHVFLFIDPDSAGEVSDRPMEELVQRAEGYNIAVHGLVPDPQCRPTALHTFCRATPGGSVDAAPLEQIPQLLAALYRGLLNRHEITYRCEGPPAEETEVRISSPFGCAAAPIAWSGAAGRQAPPTASPAA